jgi:capsular polysaccharide biosynthesis protein
MRSPSPELRDDYAVEPVERVGLGEAIRRYPLALIVPVLVLMALGGLAALRKTPTYTATSQVVINEPLSPNAAAALPGEIEAAQALAANDSRLIGANAITTPLAARFRTTSADIAQSLSATPIPMSSLIEITARRADADSAVGLANAAANRFSSYVTAQLQTDRQASDVLARYRAAALSYNSAVSALQQLKMRGSVPAGTLEQASAVVAAAQLREQALSAQYESLVQAHSDAPTISTFLLADGASSNRATQLEIYVFAGAVAGLIVGAALAAALANRRYLSTLRQHSATTRLG